MLATSGSAPNLAQPLLAVVGPVASRASVQLLQEPFVDSPYVKQVRLQKPRPALSLGYGWALLSIPITFIGYLAASSQLDAWMVDVLEYVPFSHNHFPFQHAGCYQATPILPACCPRASSLHARSPLCRFNRAAGSDAFGPFVTLLGLIYSILLCVSIHAYIYTR